MAENKTVKQMKQHDTGEPLRIQIVRKSNGQAQDLTSATATFLMYQVSDDNTMTELVNAGATVESPETDGYITYPRSQPYASSLQEAPPSGECVNHTDSCSGSSKPKTIEVPPFAILG